MQLPLDYREAPFCHKYVDEETPLLNRWFILGRYEDGTVDINDPDGEVMIRVPRDIANRIIRARDQFLDAILDEFDGIGK